MHKLGCAQTPQHKLELQEMQRSAPGDTPNVLSSGIAPDTLTALPLVRFVKPHDSVNSIRAPNESCRV